MKQYAEIQLAFGKGTKYLLVTATKTIDLCETDFYLNALNKASELGWDLVAHRHAGDRDVFIVAKEQL